MIQLKGVSKYYNSDQNVVLGLRKINAEFKIGEFVAITGESGSGKSTLLNVISGLDKYDEGEFYVNGEETSYFSVEEFEQYRKQYIGFVFQNYNIIDSYTVLENVLAALMIQGYDPKKRKQRALELIDKVGLTSHKNHRASKLSGGQKQRAVIARALAKDCPIIVADEPTGNLDSESGKMVMSLLKEVSKDKLVLVVTHNYEQVEPYATRKIRMFDGEIVEDKILQGSSLKDQAKPIPNQDLSYLDILKFALTSIYRMPKKAILMLLMLLFSMTAVSFLYSLNGFTNNTNFVDTYNPVFYNNFEGRVILTKKDTTAFTQTELDDLLAKNGVRSVIHYDNLLDENFNAYTTDFWQSNGGVLKPITAKGSITLESGRLPLNKNEIVLWNFSEYDTRFNVGDTVYLTSQYQDIWDSAFLANMITLTVVGLLETGWHDVLGYVTPSFFNQNETNTINPNNQVFLRSMPYEESSLIYNSNTIMDLNNYSVFLDNTVPTGEIYVNDSSLEIILDGTSKSDISELAPLTFTFMRFESLFAPSRNVSVRITGVQNLSLDRPYLFMSLETYGSIFSEGPYQVSFIAEDNYVANQVIDGLDSDLYNIINPFEYEGYSWDGGGFTVLITMAMIVLGLFIYIILNLVTKNIINSRKKDFIIFRSIGASKKDLKHMLYFETVLYSLIGYSITLLLLLILNNQIPNFKVLRYLDLPFFIMNYLVFLLFLFMIMRKFSFKLFGKSVITTLKSE